MLRGQREREDEIGFGYHRASRRPHIAVKCFFPRGLAAVDGDKERDAEGGFREARFGQPTASRAVLAISLQQ